MIAHYILFNFLLPLIWFHIQPVYTSLVGILLINLSFLNIILIIMSVLLAILLDKYYNKYYNKYIIKQPKPFEFVEYQFSSSAPTGTVTLSFMAFLVASSAFVFASSIFFEFSDDVVTSFFISIAKYILESIISNTARLSIEVSAHLSNTPFNFDQLTQLHAYLTPYIRSYDSIFLWTMNWVNFLDGSNSSEFGVLEEIQGRYRVAGNDLLEIYRRIETSLNIPIQDSPIAVQDWEYVE